jgi:membrane protein implicated in regulation of membrane protease activity
MFGYFAFREAIMNPSLVWFIVGLVLLIAEMFHGAMFLMWIGAAALLTALAALFIHTDWVLWLIFAVSSVALLLASRPLARSIHGRVTTPSNVDSLVGMQGVVLETIDPLANTGQVRIRSEQWRARSSVPIKQGAHVVIERIEGTTLMVKEVPAESGGSSQ